MSMAVNKNFALNPSEMKFLRDIGIDTTKASMWWECLPTNKGQCYLNMVEDELQKILFWQTNDKGIEYVPAFTLNDIIQLCPMYIDGYMFCLNQNSIRYVDDVDNDKPFLFLYGDNDLLKCGFETLKWLKKNNHI